MKETNLSEGVFTLKGLWNCAVRALLDLASVEGTESDLLAGKFSVLKIFLSNSCIRCVVLAEATYVSAR